MEDKKKPKAAEEEGYVEERKRAAPQTKDDMYVAGWVIVNT